MRRSAVYLVVLTALLAGLVCFPAGAVAGTQTLPQVAATPTTFASSATTAWTTRTRPPSPSLVASWNPAVRDRHRRRLLLASRRDGDRQVRRVHRRLLRRVAQRHHHDGDALPGGLAPVNAFFPRWATTTTATPPPSPDTYLTYFTLPGAGFANTLGQRALLRLRRGAGPLLRAQLQHAGARRHQQHVQPGASGCSAQLAASTSRLERRLRPPPAVLVRQQLHGSTTTCNGRSRRGVPTS